MQLKLYTFKICPFVERVNILINELAIQVEKEEVNIRNKPEWFLEKIPLGKVPALVTIDANNAETILFESSIILDYLQDLPSNTKNLYPADNAAKHHTKAWRELGSQLIVDAYNMTLAKDHILFDEKRKMVEEKLFLLQKELKKEPFFYGSEFGMLDLAYAPLFKRFDCLARIYNIDILAKFPKLSQWAETILSRDSVQRGFAPNFEEEFVFLLKLKGSLLELAEEKV